MELHTFRFEMNSGWSVPDFPNLDSVNTLLIVFASPEFNNDFSQIEELYRHYPNSCMIGCSTAGEISGATIFDYSLSVAILKFNNAKIIMAKSLITTMNESYAAGKSISDQLFKDDLQAIFVLSDGLCVNGSELVNGLNAGVEEKVIITGGLAADGKDFKRTFAIINGTKIEGAVVAVGFYGNHIKIGHASKGGWDIFGPERVITKSKGNILYQLDGKPALELYKEYLGERAKELPASGLLFPLSIRKQDEHSHEDQEIKKLVRTILAVNEDDQSLTFAGDMPQGYKAQLMRANFDRLITSAVETSEIALSRMSINMNLNTPFLAIGISCVGRRLVLGERIAEEPEALLQSLPKNAQLIGFYSYGEISPYGIGSCDLHNQTMTLTTICEV